MSPARAHPVGIDAIADDDAGRVALVEEGRRDITFGELRRRGDRVGHALAAWGVPPGGVLVSLMPNRREYHELRLGVSRSGRYLTPVSHHLRPAEIAYVLADSGARAVVVDPSLRDLLEEALGDGLVTDRPRVVVLGDEYERELAAQPSTRPEPFTAGDFMGYTSGTTGRPKGVRKPLPGRPPGLAAGTAAFLARCGAEPGPGVHLVVAPLYHAAPGTLSYHALELGMTVVVTERPTPEEILALVERHAVTHLFTVPTVMGRWLRLPEEVRSAHDLSSLVSVTHSGAPCPPDVKRACIEWLGPVVHEFYGSTEGSSTAVTSTEWLERPGTVGRAIPGVRVAVLDADGAPAPPGEVGQVWFVPLVPWEYLGDPEKTASAQRPGGWVSTGDLGRLDDEGWLFLADRRTDLILSGGVNLYPAEIEAVLQGAPGVVDVAVIGVPDPDWGQRAVAVVALDADTAGTGDEAAHVARILDHARDRLARYKVPREIRVVADVPRSAAGKLLRREVRQAYDTMTDPEDSP